MAKKGGSDPKLRARIGIDGEQNYKEALDGIAQQMKMLKSRDECDHRRVQEPRAPTMGNLKQRRELNEKYDLQLQSGHPSGHVGKVPGKVRRKRRRNPQPAKSLRSIPPLLKWQPPSEIKQNTDRDGGV